MPDLRSGTTAAAGEPKPTRGRGRPRKHQADTTIAAPSLPPPPPPAPRMLQQVTPAMWANRKYVRYMDLEIYEAYKHVFEENGFTREVDAPDATGPSAKFHALAANLYASFSEKEKTRLDGRAKMLLNLELQKMFPLRDPDPGRVDGMLQKHGLPDWMADTMAREIDTLAILERDPDLDDMGSLSARDEMIANLRF